MFGDVAGDSGYGMTTRETLLLYEDKCGRTVHIGGGYTYNEPATNAATLRTPPEVGFNQLDFSSTNFPVPFFVNTGPIPTTSYQVVNGELAGTNGPWYFQSEYYFARLAPIGAAGLYFHGGYAQIAYTLTGETRSYNAQQGVYSRIVPHRNYGQCGCGAWEVAARWSRIDLTDGGVDGGVLNDYTFGMNWYLNRYTKFQFNYIHADLERPISIDSAADVFAVRAQVDF